jgi:hypothetical protein
MNVELPRSTAAVRCCPELFGDSTTYQPLEHPSGGTAFDLLLLPFEARLCGTENRTQVLQDMLQLLKESVSSRHAERLEQIVIALIVIEISEAFVVIIR